jgi:GNAT superfamily N-acetyltransferase
MVTRWAGPKLVGFCGLGPAAATDKVWMSWFVVHPDYQGRGIGTRLLADTEQLARSQGYRWMFVHTFTEARFLAARALYFKAGYRRIADAHHEYSADTVLLCKCLI